MGQAFARSSLLWLLLAVGLLMTELPRLRGEVSSPEQWKKAKKDAEIHSASLYLEPDFPLLGSAYFCKSRSEYELEAIQGESGYFFCQDYVDYAAACDAADPDSCNNEFAIKHFNNFQRALNVYSCNAYSKIWTCANCTDAYKRWLCSQVYKKMYLPDTKTVETGKVSGGVSPSAYTVSCPWPPVGETDATVRETSANEKPHFVKICSGLRKDATGRPYSVVELANGPVSMTSACGNEKGGCEANIFLDPDSASTVDGFYVGSIIEISPDSPSAAAGQWAEIEAYDGYNRLAMMRKWNLAADAESPTVARPEPTDTYKIYLDKSTTGKCRDSKAPKKRAARACELLDKDKYPGLDYLPHSYMGGTRCGQDEQCIPLNKNVTDIFNEKGEYQYPDLGYVCCPMSGPRVVAVGTAEDWKVYSLSSTTAEDGSANHSCMLQKGTTREYAEQSPLEYVGAAKPALSAVESAGCVYNFTRTTDLALDFCVMRTCFPVCHDVIRRCPIHIEFNCPVDTDRREYDYSVCNVMLAHGCSMVLVSNKDDRVKPDKDCHDLNVDGYGPHPSQGKDILGLPPGATCVNKSIYVGLVRDEPPKLPPAEGQKEPVNLYWEHGKEVRKFSARGAKVETVCKTPQT